MPAPPRVRTPYFIKDIQARKIPPKPTLNTDNADSDEPVHHRWLLTTCVAGVVSTLAIGGTVLGLFGENAAPRDAYAAVSQDGLAPASQPLKTASLNTPVVEVVSERDLDDNNKYPEITSDELPYGDGKTVVLDAEIQASEDEASNITTITKTPPAEPVDESFALAKGESLRDKLIDRGVSPDVSPAR